MGAAGRRAHLAARSFVVYYGYGPLPGLERFDLAVLEPNGWSAEARRQLQDAGTTVLAYLSALEVRPDVIAKARLRDEDFLWVAGAPWRRVPDPNLVATPLSQRWRAYLTATAERLLASGWDGLFLDTLGDVEDQAVVREREWLVPQAADLVLMLRRLSGEHLLALNNGIALLLPLVHPYLDAVSWEVAAAELPLTSPWAQLLLDILGQAATRSRLLRLLTTSIPPGRGADRLVQEFTAFARRQGFLAYAAPDDYVRSIRMPDGRVLPGRPVP